MKKLKDSGVEWIGQIPAEWKRVKLKEVTNIIMGQSPEAQDIKDFGNIPFMQGNREFGSIYPNAVKFCDNSPKKSRIGDILLSVRAPVGAINVSDKVYAIGRGLCSICATSINSKFLMYFLMLIMQDTKKFGQGSTFDAITIQELKQLPVLLPPINTQNRIASYLDRKCAEIDAIIAKQQQVIEKLKEYKLSVITEAVTKGLDPNVPMKDSGVEWIGKVPEKWDISRIKYICVFNPKRKEINCNAFVSYAPMECVKDGYLIKKQIRYTDISTGLTSFEDGDIIMAKVTPCFENGNIAIAKDLINKFGVGSSELFVFRATKVNTRWLFYFLRNSVFKSLAKATMTGTGGLKRVSPDFVRDFSLALPPEKEQLKIVEFLDSACVKIDEIIKHKQEEVEKLNQYKKALIYEVVTGKMEV